MAAQLLAHAVPLILWQVRLESHAEAAVGLSFRFDFVTRGMRAIVMMSSHTDGVQQRARLCVSTAGHICDSELRLGADRKAITAGPSALRANTVPLGTLCHQGRRKRDKAVRAATMSGVTCWLQT